METNSYTSAMGRLNVTPALRERVLEGALARPVERKPRLLPIALAACLVLVVAATVFTGLQQGARGPEVLTVNPMHKSESVTQLKEDAPFVLLAPGVLPEGYAVEGTAMIAGTLAQIEYAGPEGAITYRMAPGADDISGDYNQYAVTTAERVGERDVTVKGDGTTVSLCVWTDEAHTYALSFETPVAPETAAAIIESVGPVE